MQMSSGPSRLSQHQADDNLAMQAKGFYPMCALLWP